jgi:hypothetical protein
VSDPQGEQFAIAFVLQEAQRGDLERLKQKFGGRISDGSNE